MQHHAAAAAVSLGADHNAVTLSAQAALQHAHGRRMRGLPALLRSSVDTWAATAKQQQQQWQLGAPSQTAPLDPLHGLPSDLIQRLGPIDVVYTWVNGSDPVLTRELQDFEARQQGDSAANPSGSAWVGREGPVSQSRFDADRDELRYSLRSLEMYMPWFNKVWIVTNGQASV